MKKSILLGCALAAGLASVAMAEVPTCQARGSWVQMHRVDPSNNSAYVVESAPVVAPAATVGRALSEQPVHPWMYKVRVGSTTTLLDPLANYSDDGPGRLDENHWIPRSQREFISRHGDQGAYVIMGRPDGRASRQFEPLMTILKPDALRKPGNNAPGVIPNAAPMPARKPGSMASAQ